MNFFHPTAISAHKSAFAKALQSARYHAPQEIGTRDAEGVSSSMNNKEHLNFQEPFRGRFGSEEIPHGCARDRSTCGICVVPDNPTDASRGLTENRARRVPSPRAVRGKFPKAEYGPLTTTGADL
jgi:hypothetical protein